MKTLIQRQEACIARMQEARTSERRAAKNRAAAIRQFRNECAAAGYDKPSIDLITKDVRDMYELEKNAAEVCDDQIDVRRELSSINQFEDEQYQNELKTLVRCLDPYNGCL